jgi:magnesium chelatase family protein
MATERLGLTGRAYHRALRVARTLADLTGDDAVMADHIEEALGLRYAEARRRGTAAS